MNLLSRKGNFIKIALALNEAPTHFKKWSVNAQAVWDKHGVIKYYPGFIQTSAPFKI